MAKFLSQEWTNELVAALNTSRDALKAVEVVIQQVVTDGPQGESRYWTAIDHGRVEGGLGDTDNPDVVFTQDYATAAELSRAEINPQAAFMQGRLVITGNMGKLLQQRSAIEALGPAMAAIETEY
jgi:putative sterol carrier protein